jgi:hypothetical protein
MLWKKYLRALSTVFFLPENGHRDSLRNVMHDVYAYVHTMHSVQRKSSHKTRRNRNSLCYLYMKYKCFAVRMTFAFCEEQSKFQSQSECRMLIPSSPKVPFHSHIRRQKFNS